jgi:hypothetical protein
MNRDDGENMRQVQTIRNSSYPKERAQYGRAYEAIVEAPETDDDGCE